MEPKVGIVIEFLSIFRYLVSLTERKPECDEDVQGRAIYKKCQGENAAENPSCTSAILKL